MPASTRLSTAQLLDRGDMPRPGAHEVIHITGTDAGTTVTVDTPDGRAVYTVTKTGSWHHTKRMDTGHTMTTTTFGHTLGRILRDARGDG